MATQKIRKLIGTIGTGQRFEFFGDEGTVYETTYNDGGIGVGSRIVRYRLADSESSPIQCTDAGRLVIMEVPDWRDAIDRFAQQFEQ